LSLDLKVIKYFSQFFLCLYFSENNIICFPTNSSELDDNLLLYATSYCWETTQQNVSSDCATFQAAPTTTPHNPRLLKEFIQWFPYALLFQVLM